MCVQLCVLCKKMHIDVVTSGNIRLPVAELRTHWEMMDPRHPEVHISIHLQKTNYIMCLNCLWYGIKIGRNPWQCRTSDATLAETIKKKLMVAGVECCTYTKQFKQNNYLGTDFNWWRKHVWEREVKKITSVNKTIDWLCTYTFQTAYVGLSEQFLLGNFILYIHIVDWIAMASY